MIVKEHPEVDEPFLHKKTRRGCRGGKKAKMKRQKAKERMKNEQNAELKNVSMNHNTNNGGGHTKKKHGVKLKDKGMKMKAAEHIKLNRSQSITKTKMKKGDREM